MSQLIKQKFLASIDSSKFYVAQNGALMAINSQGQPVELLKLNSQDQALLLGVKVGSKADLDQAIADIAKEILDRKAADDALDGRLDVLEGADTVSGSVAKALKDAKSYADSKVSDEASARSTADSGLQSQINTEKGRIDAILSASSADKDSFAEIVTLINSIDTENDNAFAGYVTSNNAALANEVSARQSGDSALSGRLDIIEGADTVAGSVAKALKDAKAYTDTEKSRAQGEESRIEGKVDTEKTRAQGEESRIEGKVDTEKSRAQGEESRIEGKVDTEKSRAQGEEARIEGKVDTEKSRAESAEGGLNTRVSALESVTWKAAYIENLSSTQITNQYVDLADKIVDGSLFISSDRVVLYEGVDFSISTVSGKTRVTFMGDIATGGSSALDVNDDMYFKYQYKV